MDTHHDILILGGGTGGLTVASQLAPRVGGHHIAIVEPSPKHYYQPLWTLVGGGMFRREESQRDEADLIPDGVTWIREAVAAVDPDKRTVVTSSGAMLTYGFLVVAPGVVAQWSKIPGLAESVGKAESGVTSNYSYDTVASTWEAIRSFRGGTAIFTEPITPVKCGGAPQKIMYLAEEAFRANGVRDRSRVIFMNAKPALFTAPYYIPALERVIESRGMEYQLGQELVALRPAAREAVFRDVKTGAEQVMAYDLIHVTPPMQPPEFVRASPLANADGWVEVDKFSLQHVRHPEVFGLGDASSLPTSKTGAAVRKQAPVVVDNLLALRDGRPLSARYDGYTSCPVVTGRGKLIMAEFNYAKEPVETFPVDQRTERFSMFALKAYALPRLYWHGMLRGRA
ncbi:MAG TPA: FAD/NAD(P)-binding oxidoreductase [Vicinamibacterales bacterium]|nr:FAD/NAD(P)-binding oxidoreductase [Vicinamibacterales bacterium]